MATLIHFFPRYQGDKIIKAKLTFSHDKLPKKIQEIDSETFIDQRIFNYIVRAINATTAENTYKQERIYLIPLVFNKDRYNLNDVCGLIVDAIDDLDLCLRKQSVSILHDDYNIEIDSNAETTNWVDEFQANQSTDKVLFILKISLTDD